MADGTISIAGLTATATDVLIPTALLFFSGGVEAGHFLFIGVVLLLIAAMRSIRVPFPRWIELVPPYAIGTCAAFWTIQRTLTFFQF